MVPQAVSWPSGVRLGWQNWPMGRPRCTGGAPALAWGAEGPIWYPVTDQSPISCHACNPAMKRKLQVNMQSCAAPGGASSGAGRRPYVVLEGQKQRAVVSSHVPAEWEEG